MKISLLWTLVILNLTIKRARLQDHLNINPTPVFGNPNGNDISQVQLDDQETSDIQLDDSMTSEIKLNNVRCEIQMDDNVTLENTISEIRLDNNTTEVQEGDNEIHEIKLDSTTLETERKSDDHTTREVKLNIITTPEIQQDDNGNPEVQSDGNLAPEVHTNCGNVVGTTSRSNSGRAVSVYYGIPYGQSPTGPLRFLPPKPIEPWNETLRATLPSPAPYQKVPTDLKKVQDRLNDSVPEPWSEDCLRLHVWVPQPAPVKAQVIVYIHGGAFVTETALWYIDGSSFAADEGVIFVSVEYRLGVFGFLNLGHPEAPGNMGLMDQLLGLRWVKDNVAFFGGDPDKVTLMGSSAGSASVGYHLTSPDANGLFNRVIMMSGVPTNIWAYTAPQDSLRKAESLAEAVQCRRETIPDTVSCLRSKSPEELLESSLLSHMIASVQFGPTLDSPGLVQSGHFNDADVMIGSTSDEGAEFFLLRNQEYAEKEDSGIERKDFLEVLKGIHDNLSDLEAKVLDVLYTNWSYPESPVTLRNAARHAYSDGLFVCDINQFADDLAANPDRRVYRYVYDHKVTPFWFPEIEWTRSVHCADQLSSVGPPSSRPESRADVEIRVKVVKHFANFAQTGDPNFGTEPDWPRYGRSRGRLFNLLETKSSIQSEHRTQECAVWTKLLPLLDGTR